MAVRRTQSVSQEDITTRCREVCQEAGLKLTQQRLEIFREIVQARDHPSAEELHKRLLPRMPALSLDTVYRTLGTFAGCGAVLKLQVADGSARFDGNPVRHHHFVCRECRTVYDFSWPAFDRMRLPTEAEARREIAERHVRVTGLCEEWLSGRHRR